MLSIGRLSGPDPQRFDICTGILFWCGLRLEKSGIGPSRPDIEKMRATIPGRLPQRQPEQKHHHQTKPDSRIAEHRRSAIGSELRGGPCLCPARSAGKRVVSAPRCNSSNSSSDRGQGQVSSSQTTDPKNSPWASRSRGISATTPACHAAEVAHSHLLCGPIVSGFPDLPAGLDDHMRQAYLLPD